MKEVEIGTRVRINNWEATVIKIADGLALLKTDSGSQFCYGVGGIRQHQILGKIEQQEIFVWVGEKILKHIKMI